MPEWTCGPAASDSLSHSEVPAQPEKQPFILGNWLLFQDEYAINPEGPDVIMIKISEFLKLDGSLGSISRNLHREDRVTSEV